MLLWWRRNREGSRTSSEGQRGKSCEFSGADSSCCLSLPRCVCACAFVCVCVHACVCVSVWWGVEC